MDRRGFLMLMCSRWLRLRYEMDSWWNALRRPSETSPKSCPKVEARISPSVSNIRPSSPFSFRTWYPDVELMLAGGFVRRVWRVVWFSYFPMQKFRNIFPRVSSVLISPTISPRW